MRTLLLVIGLALPWGGLRADDWPVVRHDARHSGRSAETVAGPFRVAWAHSFGETEAVATAAEPVVAGGRVFVGTHAGHLWALDAIDGRALWRADGDGSILHAAAVADDAVVFATAGREVVAVDAATGRRRWSHRAGPGGFATAPVVAGSLVLIGGRDGRFRAIKLEDGALAWSVTTGGPIRTTAAVAGDTVLFASEDMRAYAVTLKDGTPRWRSEPMAGQSLRDYYPVVLGDVAVFRTSPAVSMPERIGRDRQVLIDNAGIPATSWKELDAWLKGPATRGTAEQIEAEARAILAHLERDPSARTFHAFDVATGRERGPLPVLWAAGCQGTGQPPVETPLGPVVLWRTAYSNWNLGVAPLVGLGRLDFEHSRVVPLYHAHGGQPPWNTFWGTADESQNLSVAGNLLFLAHQGTVSTFDLTTSRLAPVAGNRDTWGGYRAQPGLRNEWHGPARSSVAIAGGRLYWLTGSRLVAIESGARSDGPPPEPTAVHLRPVERVARFAPTPEELSQRLAEHVAAYLDGYPWAPLYLDPGIAGRSFAFGDAADEFRALALAFPHLPDALQERVRSHLDAAWTRTPPHVATRLPLDVGRRRELFQVPPGRLERGDRAEPRAVGPIDAAATYAERLGTWAKLDDPEVRRNLHDRLDRLQPANVLPTDRLRALADCLAMAELAARWGDAALEAEARARADGLRTAVLGGWRKVAEGAPRVVEGVVQIDELIGRGDALWTPIRGHRAVVAHTLGLSPRAGAALAEGAAALERVVELIDRTMPGWPLAWGERPVHYGENAHDTPDNVHGLFVAHTLAGGADPAALVDIPWCPGDLFFIEKCALTLEQDRPADSPRAGR